MTRGGLPHSDILGSKLVCSSPKLFAACHVLHRLLAPRHSPYTLSSLTIRNSKLTLTNRLHVNWSATVPCRNTACVCGRKKLPCAEYSVVKDQACRASPGNLFTSARDLDAPAREQRSTIACRRRCARDSKSLTHSPKLFKERVRLRRCNTQAGLPTVSSFNLRLAHLARSIQRAKVGGEYRARTGDLLVANQALSQLS